MAAVYSTQLYVGRLDSTGTTVLFQCPPGQRTIVRDLFITHVGGDSTDTYLASVNVGSQSVTFARVTGQDANATIHTQCRIVLDQGDDVRIAVNSGTWDVVMSGYLLSAP